MILYTVFFLTPIIFYILYNLSNKYRNLYILFICFIAFLLAGLRGSVGIDTLSYTIHYERALNYGANYLFYRWEPTFPTLIYIFTEFFDDPQIFFLFLSGVQSLLLYKLTKRMSMPFLFIIVYLASFYLNFHANVLRAGLAALILSYSLLENKKYRSLALLVLSVLTHVSVLIILPVWLVHKKYLSLLKSSVIVILSLLALMAFSEFFLDKILYYNKIQDNDYSIEFISNVLFLSPLFLYFFGVLITRKFEPDIFVSMLLLLFVSIARNYYEIFYRLYQVVSYILLCLICYRGLSLISLTLQSLSKIILLTTLILVSYRFLITQSYDANSEHAEHYYIPYTFYFNE